MFAVLFSAFTKPPITRVSLGKYVPMAALTGAECIKQWPQWDSSAKNNMRGKMLSKK